MNLLKFQEINKLLVIRLSSMGDIIMTTPVPRELKKAFPSAKIDFLAGSEFLEIYENNPYVDSLIPYDRNKSMKENREIKNFLSDYDIVFDLQNNYRSRDISCGLSKNLYRIKKNRLHKLSLVYFNRSLKRNFSVIENYLDLLRIQGIESPDSRTELWLKSDADNKHYAPFFSSEGTEKTSDFPRFAIAPGATHFTKRYPANKFIDLIRELKKQWFCEIILIGGKMDTDICKEIESALDFPVINKSGSNSIIETAEHIDSCDLLISNDTGVMHIAAARQIPVICIFGSSVKELGFAPYYEKLKIVEHNISCRPCSHIGRESCPKGHFKCMNEISPYQIIKEVFGLI